ncbi:MAG: hypothetical protein KF767_04285 [Bdellovibrionaceae bacterium]|nr:hypothetical protein [Pseudobdellovibrionaceae bacterium]
MRATLKLRIVYQVCLLALIAAASGLVSPDFTQSSWDIVLFLTPVGLLKNFLAASPVLRSFYFDLSPGQTPLTLAQTVFLSVLYPLLALNGLSILREIGQRKN